MPASKEILDGDRPFAAFAALDRPAAHDYNATGVMSIWPHRSLANIAGDLTRLVLRDAGRGNGRRPWGLLRKEVSKMKSLIVIMAMLVIALGFSTVGFGNSDQQAGQTGYVCGVTEHTYTGQITSMSKTGNRIVVNGTEGDKSFVVSKAAPNGGLQANERVTVNYTEKNGQLVASSVSMPQPYHLSKELENHFREEMLQN
jgi:hypothetical protein